jgi:hypothetical protein
LNFCPEGALCLRHVGHFSGCTENQPIGFKLTNRPTILTIDPIEI